VGGIDKRRIVKDVADRKNFVKHIGKLSAGTDTNIYAWDLKTNHVEINEIDAKRGVVLGLRAIILIAKKRF